MIAQPPHCLCAEALKMPERIKQGKTEALQGTHLGLVDRAKPSEAVIRHIDTCLVWLCVHSMRVSCACAPHARVSLHK